VWIARSERPEGAKTILVPLDFSAASEQALTHAAVLAATSGAQLHLLHVYDTDDLHGLLPLSEETKAELAQWRRRARRAALDRLQHSLQSISNEHGLTADIHVVQGTPWKVICATAKRLAADLIVMGSVGRSGIPGLVVGNTAERVLHHCESSLLVVKPATISVKAPAETEKAAAPKPAASLAAT
jgi:nucleotide-binding universal stress UspA family protein